VPTGPLKGRYVIPEMNGAGEDDALDAMFAIQKRMVGEYAAMRGRTPDPPPPRPRAGSKRDCLTDGTVLGARHLTAEAARVGATVAKVTNEHRDPTYHVTAPPHRQWPGFGHALVVRWVYKQAAQQQEALALGIRLIRAGHRDCPAGCGCYGSRTVTRDYRLGTGLWVHVVNGHRYLLRRVRFDPDASWRKRFGGQRWEVCPVVGPTDNDHGPALAVVPLLAEAKAAAAAHAKGKA
jgi:hypothetical protein